MESTIPPPPAPSTSISGVLLNVRGNITERTEYETKYQHYIYVRGEVSPGTILSAHAFHCDLSGSGTQRSSSTIDRYIFIVHILYFRLI